jgi:outer membrane protein TolC
MQLDLLHEARIAYYEYWRIMRAADLTRELQRLMGEFRRVALAKYSAGQVGQQDPLQADAEIAMLDHQIVVLERERRVTIARLNVLMHDPPDEERPPPPREIALPDTSLDHRDQIERARAHRPELRVVNAEVEASEANVALSDRERWPMTTLGVVYDRFWTESELRTSVTLGLSLPIFAGRRSAARAEARARLAGSIARRDAAADRVALEVSTAVARVHETAHDLSVSRGRLVPLAERTVRATRASYEADRTDFLALLNSVRDLLRARLQADAAFTTLQLARTELDRAVGEMPSFLEEEQP